MDWDSSLEDHDLIDETLADMPVPDIVASLPNGPPSSTGGRGGKLTDDDRAMVAKLREVAYAITMARPSQTYCHTLILEVLQASVKGRGCEHLFRYIAVHGHRASAKSDFKWCRVLPQHRGPKGKKYEVYKLVDAAEEIPRTLECGCAMCGS